TGEAAEVDAAGDFGFETPFKSGQQALRHDQLRPRFRRFFCPTGCPASATADNRADIPGTGLTALQQSRSTPPAGPSKAPKIASNRSRSMAQNSSRNPGRHFLQIPGPSPVPDRVLSALSMPIIDHRGPEFAKI